MNGVGLIRDLAVVMIVSGLITLLFRRLRQPVVLGYLLAGCLLGPHTFPWIGIERSVSVQELADLGLVFLMFSLGLDFSLRKLRDVGTTVGLAAVFEVGAMVWLGYTTGVLLGWARTDCVLLAMGLAATSTTIVVKSLRDAGELNTPHANLFTGLSIVEDLIVILFMAFLPGFAGHERPTAVAIGGTLARLVIFLVVAVVLGLLAVPRLLNYVNRFRSNELLLITVLSLLFGFTLLMVSLEYSVALGAFIVGSLVAESRAAGRVRDLMSPLRDMFSAVFFVSIGMLIDPRAIGVHLVPVLVIATVFMVGKIVACTFGLFVTGTPAPLSLRVGLHMAQLGEFAFVVAGIGAALGMAGGQLFPVVVAVAAVNALVRPYLVGHAEVLGRVAARKIPKSVTNVLAWYNHRLAEVRRGRKASPASRFAVSLLLQLAVNAALAGALFLVAAYCANRWSPPAWTGLLDGALGEGIFYWVAALLACMPIIIASHRKLEALAMLLAEIVTPAGRPGASVLRPVLTRMLHVAGLAAFGGVVVVTSAALLPGWPALLLLVLFASVLGLLFGRSFNAWYSRTKFALVETWDNPPPPETEQVLPPMLSAAAMEHYVVPQGPPAGKLIRELNLRARTGVSIVAIERAGRTTVNPGPDDELQAGDRLLLLGDPPRLREVSDVLEGPPRPG